MEELEKLYQVVSGRFNIGTFEEFSSKMTDTGSRKRFYDLVSTRGFDLGDYNKYEQRLSKREVPKGVNAEQNGESNSASVNSPSLSDSKKNTEKLLDPSNMFEMYPLGKDYQHMQSHVDKLRKKSFIPIMEKDEEFKKELSNIEATGNLEDVDALKQEYISQLYTKYAPKTDLQKGFSKDTKGLEVLETRDENFVESKYSELSERPDFKYKSNKTFEGVKEKEGEFVDISSKSLETIYGNISDYNIDIEDFNSFIELGNDRIKKLNRAGYFKTNSTDLLLTSDEEKQLREAAKNKALVNYVGDRIIHLRGKHLGLIRKGKKEEALLVQKEITNTAKGYQDYVSENLPNYKRTYETKLADEYKEYLQNETIGNFKKSLNTVRKSETGFLNGILNAAGDASAYLFDIVGADDYAEYQRMVNEYNDEFENNSLAYGVVSGKKVYHNGKNYLTTETGRIIDTDAGKEITVIADRLGIDRQEILNKGRLSNLEDTTYSPSGLVIKGSEVLGNLAFQIAATKGTTGALNVTTRTGTMITSMAVQSGMVASSTYEETLSQLRDANIDDDLAKGEALDLSLKMGTITALTSILSPNTSALGMTTKSVDKKLVKKLASAYASGGKESFKKVLWEQVKDKGITMSREGLEESLQELTEIVSQKHLNSKINRNIDKEVLDTALTKDEIIETFVLSNATAGLMAANGKTQSDFIDRLSIIDHLSKDVEQSTSFIKSFKEEEAISPTIADKMIKDINNYAAYSNKIPDDISLDKVEPLLEILDKRNKLELRKKNEDKAFHSSINEQILSLDGDIDELMRTRQAKRQDIKEVSPKNFSNSMKKSLQNQNNTDKKEITETEAQNIVDNGGKLFMTKDGKAGAYVEADGYMGGLFKGVDSNLKNVSKVLQEVRIEAGGKYFDAYGDNLESTYIKNGFKPVARIKFDESSDSKNKSDTVFFVYDPKGKYVKGEGQYFTDYNKAKEFAKNFNDESNTETQTGDQSQVEVSTGESKQGINETETNTSNFKNVPRDNIEIKDKVKTTMSKLKGSDPTVFEIAWNDAIETVSNDVELTGNLAQSINNGLEKLRKSDWYKKLSEKGRNKAERMFKEDLNRQFDDGTGELSNPSFLDTNKANFYKTRDAAIQKIIDKYYILRKKINTKFNIYDDSVNFSQAEKLMHGKGANDLDKFDKEMKTIVTDIASRGLSIKEVSDYLYAKHAEERNKHIKDNVDPENEFGSGMTPQEIDKTLNKTFTDSQIKDLEELSKTFTGIIQSTRNIMLESGLITQEQYNTFVDYYKNYVPLQGFENKIIEYSDGIQGSDINVSGHVSEISLGRSTRADNVIANIISQRVDIVLKARKNEVLQTLHKLASENKDNDVMTLSKTVPKKSVTQNSRNAYVGVKIKGEQFYIKFANKELGRILNSANIEKSRLITKTLGRINRYLVSTLTTLNPEFVISNFAKDIQVAVFNLSSEADINGALKGQNITKQTVKDTRKAISAIYSNERSGKTDSEFQKYYNEFKEDGAKTGWANQNNLADIKKKLENIHNLQTNKNIKNTIKGKTNELLDFVNDVNTAVENGVRLSAYINARRVGVTRNQAAEMAKELTINFNQSGEWGTLVNSLYLFFNVAMQGNVRFIKSLATLKKTVQPDGSVKKSLNRGQKIALSMVAFSSVITMLNQAITDEDEDGQTFYSKIPDYEKERNLIFMNPVNGKDYFKIPLPYGYNIFHNMGTVATEVSSGDRTVGDGIGFLTTSALASFSPISFSDSDNLATTSTRAIVPTVIKPFYDLSVNEDFFGSTIYNENMPFSEPKPDATMGRKTTPKTFKNISNFLNEVSGGNDFESGALDFAPESLYYLFKFSIGGTGKFLQNTAETTGAAIDGVQGKKSNLEIRKIPFVKKVYGEPNDYVDQEMFYKRYNLLRQRTKAIKDRINNNKSSSEDKRIYPKVAGTSEIYKQIAEKLSSIRRDKKDAKKIKNSIIQTQRLRELDNKYFKYIKKANGKFNQKLGKNYD